MKSKIVVSSVVLAIASTGASALDLGPFYVKFGSLGCDRAAIYFRPDMTLYGREIGCRFSTNPYSGHFDPTTNTFYISTSYISSSTFKTVSTTYQLRAIQNQPDIATTVTSDGLTAQTASVPLFISLTQ